MNNDIYSTILDCKRGGENEIVKEQNSRISCDRIRSKLSREQKDPDNFASVVAGAAELGLTQKELARDFEVSEMVIEGWANGTAHPHPRIQQYVVETLKTLALTH